MPPKRPGPIVENTVKRPRSLFPLNRAKASVLEQEESVVRSFRKCGITIALDGSEDCDINIRKLGGYTVGAQDSESEDSDTSSESDDEYEHEPNSWEEDAVGNEVEA
ncbi:hypothetical protein EV426DRAFT_706584 [Tirmania nivea]|nr:hypothetical protein EV426DRAFT_706584 [Tirmania nivea]